MRSYAFLIVMLLTFFVAAYAGTPAKNLTKAVPTSVSAHVNVTKNVVDHQDAEHFLKRLCAQKMLKTALFAQCAKKPDAATVIAVRSAVTATCGQSAPGNAALAKVCTDLGVWTSKDGVKKVSAKKVVKASKPAKSAAGKKKAIKPAAPGKF